ncbi:MAG: hypothetical protein WAM14_16435, partial [Candidatus Nitrosopolaris sp.]
MKFSCSYVAKMFISKMVPSSVSLPPSNRNNEGVNGRFPDFAGYLLVVFLAKSTQIFRLSGKEIDNSIYFTLYQLSKVADSFKQTKPYHLPIHYDRTKAIKIYNMVSKNGLVIIKKIEGNTYVTTTKKGDEVSEQLLQNFIAYGELTNVNKTDSEEKFKAGLLQDVNTTGVSNEVKSKVYELSNLLSALEEQGGYFTDFISTSGIQAGII